MSITEKQKTELLDSYESNKEDLKNIRRTIRNDGCLNNGLCEAEESFEQGWNNCLEYVFATLGIKF